MIRFCMLCALLVGAFFVPAAQAAAPSLLVTALQKLIEDEEEWAYTQVYRRVDKPNAETIAHFDPTRPRDRQWHLIKLRGKTPSTAEAEKWYKRRTQETEEKDAQALLRILDLDRATVSSETEDCVRYEVPLKKNAIKRLPSENFVLFAEVHPEDRSLLRFSFMLREAFRFLGGVAEVQSIRGEVLFQPFENGETTRPTYGVASGSGQALFKKVNRRAEVFYLNQRRVKS